MGFDFFDLLNNDWVIGLVFKFHLKFFEFLFEDFYFFNDFLFGLNFLRVTFVLGSFDLDLKSGEFFISLFLIGFSGRDLSLNLILVSVSGQ
jgi:hypothetical protein